jgi:hypothetical protein
MKIQLTWLFVQNGTALAAMRAMSKLLGFTTEATKEHREKSPNH